MNDSHIYSDTCTLWSFADSDLDAEGNYQFKPPRQLACSYQDEGRLVITGVNEESFATSRIYIGEDIAVVPGEYIAPGAVLNVTSNPKDAPGAQRILAVRRITSFDGQDISIRIMAE